MRSIKSRLLISTGGNIFRAALSFAAGLIVARALGPANYGDMSFLIGSFTSILSLLNMGSSSAFFTHISQHRRGPKIYIVYFSWLAIQFLGTQSFVTLIIPTESFEKIWLGNSREIVALAFAAIFMQQSIWQTISQIAESTRNTAKIQALNIAIAVTYLAAIWLSIEAREISVTFIFSIITAQYALAALAFYFFLHDKATSDTAPEQSYRKIVLDMMAFCRPLVILSAIGFFYSFASNWMLQRFGGSAEQGYFQIASQFASVCLLATSSILNVFWKEIAEATAKGDNFKVESLYKRVNRGLVILNAVIAGFLLPWSEQIVLVLLGNNYSKAWPILAIMLLYPIHQSMGQIGSSMLLAQGKTKVYGLLGTINILFISLPIMYLTLAPTSGVPIPGLGLGAMGMAVAIVLINFLGVTIQALVIANVGRWKFDWLYQCTGIPAAIALGFLAKSIAEQKWSVSDASLTTVISAVLLSGVLYAVFIFLMLWAFPWLVGTERYEINNLLRSFSTHLRLRKSS